MGVSFTNNNNNSDDDDDDDKDRAKWTMGDGVENGPGSSDTASVGGAGWRKELNGRKYLTLGVVVDLAWIEKLKFGGGANRQGQNTHNLLKNRMHFRLYVQRYA